MSRGNIVREPAVTRFGTFIKPLRAIYEVFQPKKVIEFGPGFISTEFFLKGGAQVNSVEMCSSDWHQKLVEHYAKYKNLNLMMGNAVSYRYLSDEFLRADLGFVDGHPDTRAECVTALFDRCPIIVAHDLDLDGNHYERVVPPEHYSFYACKELSPHTGVWFDNRVFRQVENAGGRLEIRF